MTLSFQLCTESNDIAGRRSIPISRYIQPWYHMWESQSEYGMIFPARIG